MSDEVQPAIHDIPIGIDAAGMRHETDSMGGIDVPADRYWGAQTQRSLEHFRISSEKMPPELIRALLLIKRSAARVNAELGILDRRIADAVIAAADEHGLAMVFTSRRHFRH